MGYRDVLYEQYGSMVQGRCRALTPQEARQWARGWERHIRSWLPSNRDAAILDLGCGCGKLLSYLKSCGYEQLRGIDISADQVELARQLHADVECSDAGAFLPQHAGNFDLIMAIDVIEHHTRDELIRLLRDCHGALRPGGRLIVQTPNGDSPFHGSDWFGDLSHETCLTPKTLGQLLRHCGFEQYQARECGPIPHGMFSTARFLLWRAIRAALLGINLVETGFTGSRILTRVFVASGVKP